MELTILMPCLNEEETLAVCIRKAKKFLENDRIDGEVLVADNGSTDRSREIAEAEGARVVSAEIRGYGSALITGTVVFSIARLGTARAELVIVVSQLAAAYCIACPASWQATPTAAILVA